MTDIRSPSRPSRIEGFAIVSADGMLADAGGVMPDSLKFDADQRFFSDGLDGVDAVVHGRNSHEMQPHSPQRHRIVVTRTVVSVAPNPDYPKAIFWNPAGADLSDAWAALGLENGTLGVIGGTEVFGMFLDRYDVFYLSHAPHVRLPGGVPVFPEIPPRTADDILAAHGLKPGAPRVLDAAADLTVVPWSR